MEENENRHAELEEAVKNEDAKNVKLYAHAIKGAASNLGATKLAEVAFKLEKMSMDEDLSQAKELFEEITSQFRKLQKFVENSDWIEIAKAQAENKTIAVG
jgi:HPt (histidine-containing phosphotransfer) domain-containing protein